MPRPGTFRQRVFYAHKLSLRYVIGCLLSCSLGYHVVVHFLFGLQMHP
jgi:hypothetical protein